MINQQIFKDKVKHFFDRFGHKNEGTSQADGVVDVDVHDIKTDNESTTTAPVEKDILSDGTTRGQQLVWENENASMQDKSYAFGEDNTDADYDFEDDLEFEDDSGSGQESRYS